MPAPPYSAGQGALTRPISQASLKTCMGKRPSRSASAATGMMRSLVKRRAVSTRAFCSSLWEKSITRSLLHSLALLLELGADGAGAEGVPGDEPHEEHERDVDDVGARHLSDVEHQPPPSPRSCRRALSMAAESVPIRSSRPFWRRQE